MLTDIVACVVLKREIRQQLAEKAKAGELKVVNGSAASQAATKRKRRWDQTADQTPSNTTPKKISSWDQADSTAEVGRPLLWRWWWCVSPLVNDGCVCSRLQVTPRHTHLQTADGTRPPVAQKAARLQGRRRAPACGTPPRVTPQPGLPRLAGTRRVTPRPATAVPPEACAKTDGTRHPRQNVRRRDTAAAGRRRHAPTGMSLWVRLPPRGRARGSPAGTKRPPARWAHQLRCSPQAKLQ